MARCVRILRGRLVLLAGSVVRARRAGRARRGGPSEASTQTAMTTGSLSEAGVARSVGAARSLSWPRVLRWVDRSSRARAPAVAWQGWGPRGVMWQHRAAKRQLVDQACEVGIDLERVGCSAEFPRDRGRGSGGSSSGAGVRVELDGRAALISFAIRGRGSAPATRRSGGRGPRRWLDRGGRCGSSSRGGGSW